MAYDIVLQSIEVVGDVAFFRNATLQESLHKHLEIDATAEICRGQEVPNHFRAVRLGQHFGGVRDYRRGANNRLRRSSALSSEVLDVISGVIKVVVMVQLLFS